MNPARGSPRSRSVSTTRPVRVVFPAPGDPVMSTRATNKWYGARAARSVHFSEAEVIDVAAAYILVSVEAGQARDVLDAIRALEGSRQAHTCWGQPDIFA